MKHLFVENSKRDFTLFARSSLTEFIISLTVHTKKKKVIVKGESGDFASSRSGNF